MLAKSTFASLTATLLLAAATARAQGVLLPTDASHGPVSLVSHRVQVTIDNHVAETRMEQVFTSAAPTPVPCDYLLPIPPGAAVTDLTLTINGKQLKGEIAEKGAARAEYMRLVGRTQNPGLLEYMNHGLMRLAVGNVEPGKEQKVEIRWSQVLPVDKGLAAYELPLRTTAAAAAAVQKDFTVGVRIKSAVPLSTVYSPTHTVKVSRPNAHEAVLGFEKDQARLDRDFRLYYGITEKEFGLNLLAHRPDASKPGWFLFLISPKSEVNTAKIIKRDVVFVLDISGSMRGEKLTQAKAAMKYCVNRLNEGDRFSIVEFDSNVYAWTEELVPASRENIDKALAHIDTIREKGGTNINDALLRALAYKREAGRPGMIVFLTDGLPTSGVRDARQITRNVLARRTDNLRIFSFGVGYDVNTNLLDTISNETNAASEYVKPGEDIEVKVSQFYGKAGRPVLADLKLEIEGNARIVEVYPKRLPDMFAGSQIAVFGRYEGAGAVKVKVTGNAGGKPEAFAYDVVFPEKSEGHKFVEPLWAQRKIGYILDALRTQNNEELKNEVIRLSKMYGIPTPYTSFVAQERTAPAAGRQQDFRARGGAVPGVGPGGIGGQGKLENRNAAADPNALPPNAPKPAEQARRESLEKLLQGERKLEDQKGVPADRPHADGKPTAKSAAAPAAEAAARAADRDKQAADELAKSLAFGLKADSGKDAVAVAGYLRKLKEAEGGAGVGAGDYRQASGMTFFRYGQFWVDERFAAESELIKVKFGSEAYFKLLEAKPEWTDAFKLGNALIIVTAEGKAVVIGAEGEEKLDAGKLAALFTPAPKKPEAKEEKK
jgi:Ca-activated chloride channel family protein